MEELGITREDIINAAKEIDEALQSIKSIEKVIVSDNEISEEQKIQDEEKVTEVIESINTLNQTISKQGEVTEETVTLADIQTDIKYANYGIWTATGLILGSLLIYSFVKIAFKR